MFYRKIYPPSWSLIKENRFLLIFGLFASILGFNEVKLFLTFSDSSPDFLSSTFNFWLQFFSAFAQAKIAWTNLPALLGLALVFILLVAIVILAISSQGALVKAAAEKSLKVKNRFSNYLYQGIAKFWPLFGLHLINMLIGYFLVTMVILPLTEMLALSSDRVQYLLLSMAVFFILLPMVLIFSFVTRYGMSYVMIKNESFWSAFIKSWELFKINWLITIENAVVISVITLVFLMAMAAAMVFAFTPFFILSVFVAGLSLNLYFLMILIGSLAGIFILIVASAIFGAYYNIVWAKVFIDLTTGTQSHSKIYRIIKRHHPRLAR